MTAFYKDEINGRVMAWEEANEKRLKNRRDSSFTKMQS